LTGFITFKVFKDLIIIAFAKRIGFHHFLPESNEKKNYPDYPVDPVE
jgi:hypothetical protein